MTTCQDLAVRNKFVHPESALRNKSFFFVLIVP